MKDKEAVRASLQELEEIAVAAAQAGGGVLKERLGRAGRVEVKGHANLVSEADYASEEAMVGVLQRESPSIQLVAEERSISAAVREDDSPFWLVDPLDGTTNYVHRYPCYGVTVALVEGEEVLLGVIYDPYHDELYAAREGEGAKLNGAPIKVSEVERIEEALLVTGFPYEVGERVERTLGLIQRFLGRTHGVRRDGSAAMDLCYIATGRLDGFWEYGLAPWDVAAGSLIVREAGGRVSGTDGGSFRLGGEAILATNGKVHSEMMAIIGEAAA